MEEKLTKLFITVKDFSEKSEKYYVEFRVDFVGIEISIRNKHNYEYIETRTIYLKEIGTSKIDELIKFIKNYEVRA